MRTAGRVEAAVLRSASVASPHGLSLLPERLYPFPSIPALQRCDEARQAGVAGLRDCQVSGVVDGPLDRLQAERRARDDVVDPRLDGAVERIIRHDLVDETARERV